MGWGPGEVPSTVGAQIRWVQLRQRSQGSLGTHGARTCRSSFCPVCKQIDDLMIFIYHPWTEGWLCMAPSHLPRGPPLQPFLLEVSETTKWKSTGLHMVGHDPSPHSTPRRKKTWAPTGAYDSTQVGVPIHW